MKRKSSLFLFSLISTTLFSSESYSKIIDCPTPPGSVKMGEVINNIWIVGYKVDNENKFKRKEKIKYNLTEWFTAYTLGYVKPTYSIIGCCALINDTQFICLNRKIRNYRCDILPANMKKAIKRGKFNPNEISFKCDKL